MLVTSQIWFPLGREKQGPVIEANQANAQPRPRKLKRPRPRSELVATVEVTSRHLLCAGTKVLCDLTAYIPHVKKHKFSPCIRTWQPRDPPTATQFKSAFKVKTMTVAVATATGADADTANRVESTWSKLKDTLLDAATEVCGFFKNHQLKSETWWWNEQVDGCFYEKIGLKLPPFRKGPFLCSSITRKIFHLEPWN